MIKKLLLLAFLSNFFVNNSIATTDIDEFFVEEDSYIGVKFDFNEYQPMVYLSNITEKFSPSNHVRATDRLITSLASAKTAHKDLFKNSNKKVSYVNPALSYTIKKVLKTAVYKNNIPDEYTTYILEDNFGKTYALPSYELENISKIKLDSYFGGLIEKFKQNNHYARVVIYFKKPKLFKDKVAPFDQKDLNSVFNYFLDSIKGLDFEKPLLSNRNFRLSLNINTDTLVYLISEFDNLYIEDLEVIANVTKKEQEQDYSKGKVRFKKNTKEWFEINK